ncbi:SIS domain-containing protein [Enterococcus sp. HY326]|uniref:SIS domain-containing protein n=1 Tax=Enterococcus sp. HY326 TaxID=2971265 RepID=UPI003A0FDF8A
MAVSDIDQKIIQASQYIHDSTNIVFLGLGSSAILCKYAVRFLFSFGIVSSYVDDPYYPQDIRFPEETVFIIVSVSGDTPDTIQFINNFKKHHGKVISITNYANNTISRLSDVNIPYYVHPEFIGLSNITTQVPVIYILESIGKQVYKLSLEK